MHSLTRRERIRVGFALAFVAMAAFCAQLFWFSVLSGA